MDRRHGPLRSHQSLEHYWPSLRSVTNGTARRPSPWLTLPPQLGGMTSFANTSSMRPKQRHGYDHVQGHRSGSAGGVGYPYHGDTASVYDFHFRQFSEDSGFSSCGSSASSVADEFEATSHLSVSKTTVWPERPTRWSTSPVCGTQSDTVASVLAAGVSDSEETDHCESDDDSNSNFMDKPKFNRFYSPLRKAHFTWPKYHSAVMKRQSSSRTEKHTVEVKSQLDHYGRDILDLGTNLVTEFPLRATELPERSLSLFLQNRSQYHRLGKFGTIEKLCFADCKKKCGFAFPIPPGENSEQFA